jgi:hypothetical protein
MSTKSKKNNLNKNEIVEYIFSNTNEVLYSYIIESIFKTEKNTIKKIFKKLKKYGKVKKVKKGLQFIKSEKLYEKNDNFDWNLLNNLVSTYNIQKKDILNGFTEKMPKLSEFTIINGRVYREDNIIQFE